MKREVITVEQVKALAQEYYCKGGDVICECFDDKQIQEYIDGDVENYIKPRKSKTAWLKLFKLYEEQEIEERAAARWYSGEDY